MTTNLGTTLATHNGRLRRDTSDAALRSSLTWVASTELCEQGVVNATGVVAVIVTYRSEFARLEENIAAIAPQVDYVLVYCNDATSSDGLEEFLESRGCIYCLDAENAGLSKALNRSCALARGLGATHALLLDQDSVAGADLVARELACFANDVALVSPQIVDRNKREGKSDNATVAPITRAITSGALISLEDWKQVGGFYEALFVDWVDYEFSCNLRAHGYRLLRNNAADILHEMGRREYAFTLPTPGGGRQFYRTNHSKGRLKDKARSWYITKRKYRGTKAGREESSYIFAIAIRDLVLERERIGTIKAFREGAREARRYLKLSEAHEDERSNR